MKVLLFLCSLFVVVFTTPTTLQQDSKWHQFKLTHSKTYGNLDEEQKRYTIFNENLQEIEEHNKRYEQGLTTYRKGINKFADWTRDEFVSYLTAQTIPQPAIVGTFVPPSNIQLPSAVDWRDKDAVTRVKNQGMCGSCWAFSAVGSLEGQNAIKTGKLVEFSEQQLVDCVKEYANGCKGGRVDAAFTYIKENGLTYENEYKYEHHQRQCRREGKPEAVRVNGFVNLDRNNETALQIAVATIGPISINVDATEWQLYYRGIFNNEGKRINHAVLIVGYGTSNEGVDYWIIKNSWSYHWGEQGYMRLIRGENACLVALQALYPVL